MGKRDDSKDGEARAKDLVRGGLTERKPLGARIQERVGRRAKSGPGSARRSRLFDRLGLADPYDASAKEKPLSIGPVALKLGEKRRVAPHAAVKDPNKKKRQAAKDPVAKWRPKGVPKAKAKPTAPKAAPPKAAPRPQAAAAKGALAKPGSSAPEAPQEELPRPTLGLPPKAKKARAGRFRMQRTPSSGPKVRAVAPKAAPPKSVEQPPAPKPAEPVNRSAPKGDLGLDDLFGMGGGEGRMRIPGRTKKK